MKILPFVLCAGTLLLSHQAVAQTAPQPSSPAAPTASGSNPAPGGPASGTATAATPTRQIQIAVSALTEKNLKGQNDAALGSIARVVESTADDKTYIVVSRGGLLGFFEKQYLVPVDQIAVAGDRVVAKNITQAGLEGSAPFVDDPAAYKPLEDTRLVSISEPR